MFDFSVLMAVFGSIGLLLFLILRLRIPAFLSLLIASIVLGVFAGVLQMKLLLLFKAVWRNFRFCGYRCWFRYFTWWSLGTFWWCECPGHTTFTNIWKKMHLGHWFAQVLLAIPVFFDVAFILLIPLIYSLQRKTGKSIYSTDSAFGWFSHHTRIYSSYAWSSTAEILSANLGWVILFGFLVGFPTAMVSGPLFLILLARKYMLMLLHYWIKK